MTDITIHKQMFQASVLHPGDKVVLTTNDTDLSRAQQMMQDLGENFPDVEFVIIAGISGVVVVPAAPFPTGTLEAAQNGADAPLRGA